MDRQPRPRAGFERPAVGHAPRPLRSHLLQDGDGDGRAVRERGHRLPPYASAHPRDGGADERRARARDRRAHRSAVRRRIPRAERFVRPRLHRPRRAGQARARAARGLRPSTQRRAAAATPEGSDRPALGCARIGRGQRSSRGLRDGADSGLDDCDRPPPPGCVRGGPARAGARAGTARGGRGGRVRPRRVAAAAGAAGSRGSQPPGATARRALAHVQRRIAGRRRWRADW